MATGTARGHTGAATGLPDLRIFPTARQADSARLPTRQKLVGAVTGSGFRLFRWTAVTQVFAENHLRCIYRIGLRSVSNLAVITGEESEAGMELLREHCHNAPTDKPVTDDINLFVLQGMTGHSIGKVAWAAAPFFLMMVIGVVIITIFPQIALWLPEILLGK